MQLEGKALRVTIYIGESDRYRGKALYMALLELLKREGAAGATVVRGLAGFGAHSRIHTATILTLSEDLPLRLEWVDQQEVVERLLPRIRLMVNDGLITLDEVQVVQYAPGRQADPLQQTVANVMRTEVSTVRPQTAVADVVTLLLRRGRRSLPVVDDEGGVVGIITDGDLLRRAGVSARLGLQDALSEEQLREQVKSLQASGKTAADIMTRPVITVGASDTVHRAMDLMVGHGLKRLPVVDEQKRLVGWVSRVDVLRTLAYHEQSLVTDAHADDGHSIAELMYRGAPTVGRNAGLEAVIQALEGARHRRVVVVDDAGRVMGIISDGDVLRRSRWGQHPSVLVRLRSLITGQRARVELPESDETAADLMSAPVVTVAQDTPLIKALQLMLAYRCKRLPVIDEQRRPVGLLGRGSVLRGLLQENESEDQD